jgi:hypothetical protein
MSRDTIHLLENPRCKDTMKQVFSYAYAQSGIKVKKVCKENICWKFNNFVSIPLWQLNNTRNSENE